MLTLHHYTSAYHLPTILATGGLHLGELPLGNGESLRATWFTTEQIPDGHGLDGSAVDKAAVRITVRFGVDRPVRVERFEAVARKYHLMEVYRDLAASGGGLAKAKSWYVYPVMVGCDEFDAIEFRREDGTYTAATAAELTREPDPEHLAYVLEVFADDAKRRAAA